MESKKILQEIKDLLHQFEREIEYDNSGEEFDINCYAEDFYAGLLNRIFKGQNYNLVNLNRIRANFPAIDIGDEENKVAFQITTTATLEKIQKTFDIFFSEKHKKLKLPEKYKKLYFILLKGKGDIVEKDFRTINKPSSFNFDKTKHILDNTDIINLIINYVDINNKVDSLKDIRDFIKKENGKKPNFTQIKPSLQKEIQKSNSFGELTLRFVHLANFSEDVYKSLKKDIIKKEKEKSIDFVISNGGLLSANSDDNNFHQSYLNKFKSIIEDINVKVFVITPGINDVISDKDPDWQEKGIANSLTNNDEVADFIKNEKSSKTFAGILRIKDFKDFETNYLFNNYKHKFLSAFDSNLIIQFNNKNVGIASLNTVWQYHKNSQDCKIILGVEQIENSLNELINCDIKVAVMNHPFDYFKEFERKDVINRLKNFDIILFNSQFKTSVYTGFLENSFIDISLPELLDANLSNYSIIDYNIRHKYINYEVRTYDSENEYFKYYDNKIYNFPTEQEIILDKRNQEFVRNIQKTYIEDFDTHLVCYGISKTNQNLDNIFVLPLITDSPFYDSEDEKIQIFSIDDLIEIKNDILIFGQKESGKTILLDKIITSITAKYNRLKIVPVYINYSELGNKKIITAIKEYLSGQTVEIKERLNNGSIVLLIDNITFDDLYTHRIRTLNNFKKKYPDIRIIATTIRASERDNLSVYIENYSHLKFKYIYLQSFRTKQIKELISKWFSNNPSINENKFDSILKSFRAFGFPRTPMSVSLFLWIIEKQENKPINNAKLLEKFIESLLEKINKEEIYSEKFDYDNKIHLLAKIANFMLEKENDNYSLEHSDLLDYVYNYFKTQKFETVFDAQKIIDNLIDRGIFIKYDSKIRFRFASFFSFFLAKQMQFEPQFKEFVITKENYLNFTDEINYFTGLERNAEFILEILSERIDYEFMNLNSKISKQLINEYFETTKSVVDDIDFNNVIENKPTTKELEQLNDEILEKTPVKRKIEKKATDKNSSIKLDLLLKLTSNVLKNTELINKNENLKTEVYNKVVKYNTLLLFRDKFFYSIYFDKFGKLPDFIPPYITFKGFIKILPLLFQVVLYDWVGSKKLSQVVYNKIKEDKNNIDVSDLEKFMSIFIYSDIEAQGYPKVIKDYIKGNARSNTIRDLSFFKIMTYFYLRTKPNSDSEKLYLELLAELKMKSRQFSKEHKNQIIKQLKEHKDKNIDLFED